LKLNNSTYKEIVKNVEEPSQSYNITNNTTPLEYQMIIRDQEKNINALKEMVITQHQNIQIIFENIRRLMNKLGIESSVRLPMENRKRNESTNKTENDSPKENSTKDIPTKNELEEEPRIDNENINIENNEIKNNDEIQKQDDIQMDDIQINEEPKEKVE